MAQGVYKITEQFEQELCRYTGAPYAVAIDNMSNALFLALYYECYINENFDWNDIDKYPGLYITIPTRTYPSVACEIIHCGKKVKFEHINGTTLKGSYQLKPTKVWDSALRFTSGMYTPGQHQCISFTGPYKHLKLGKGGAILTDDEAAYKWFKKARFSGRDECSYHDDNFDENPVIGWNMYLLPEISARGVLLMTQFYDINGKPKSNEDLELPYPDLSKFKIWQ